MRNKTTSRLSLYSYLSCILLAFCVGLSPAILNFAIDPYELIFKRERSGKLAEIAEKAHYPLWKLGSYDVGAYDTIILGDSRARALREKYWASFQFNQTKNLAYGGGTIPEIYETYKLIKNDPAIKNLIIGIQLRSFDEDHKQGMNRVPEALALIKNPMDYVFNWTIAKTSLKLAGTEHPHVASVIRGETIFSTSANAAETKRQLPEKFARQVIRNAKSDWKHFEFSEKYWSYIEEIGKWSKANDKTLIFVIPPTIVEMQNTISAYGHSDKDSMLRRRLAQLGLVLDFDKPGSLTANIGNFTDAYHFNAKVARQIAGEIILWLTKDHEIRKLVKKRRSLIDCQSLETVAPNEGRVSQQGSNCRIWRRVSL